MRGLAEIGRYDVVTARRNSNTAGFTAAGTRGLAVAGEDIDSVEWIAGKHPAAAAAAVAVDLEAHNVDSAASVGWKRLGPIVESKLWEIRILHAQAVS